LNGARLVTASETEEGRAWAESRIKQITGGDRISARFMRQDFFEFDPAFKLLIVGNHKPILRNVDDAAKRRFNIIPFVHKPEQRDLELENKLRAEYPAILRWMIDGCLDWGRNGLIRPRSVSKATDEYFSSQDLFGQWLEECCELHPGNELRLETAADLFASWEAFAASHGEKPGNSKTLGDKLSQLGAGLVRKRHPMNGKTCVMRTGISLVRPPQQWGNDD
jgi:putative DNA primase/helicase